MHKMPRAATPTTSTKRYKHPRRLIARPSSADLTKKKTNKNPKQKINHICSIYKLYICYIYIYLSIMSM